MLKFLVKLAGAVMILAAIASCKKNENQDFGMPEMGVSTESVDFSKEGGQYTISLYSTRDWTAQLDSAAREWLTVSPEEGAPSKDSVSVIISALPNAKEDRHATISFDGGAVNATVYVFQTGEIQKEYTPIADVRALYTGEQETVTVTEAWTVCGTVISNVDLNNATSMKNVVIQDESAGIMIRLTKDYAEFKRGDVVEVNVQNMSLEQFNGLLQLNNVPLENVTEIRQNAMPEAKVISAAQLLTGDYESQYVAVENVQVVESDLGKTWMMNDQNTSINFEAETGERFEVRTSFHADALGKIEVPGGSGTLKGIAQCYYETAQIMLSSTEDYAGLNGERFESTSPEPDDYTVATVEEVLAADVDDNVWYKLTGTITDLYDTEYGNFTLVDKTGSILVYGLTAEKASYNDKSFSTLGLEEGDIVTLIGTRDEYNDKPQIGGPAYYVSHEDDGGEDPDEPDELVDIADVRALYSGSNVTVNSGWAIRGTVISNMDLNNSNSKKNIVLQDESAGIMVRLKEDNTEFKFGDVIEVNIEGQSLEKYDDLLQINGVPNANVKKISEGEAPVAKNITVAQLCDGDFESQYVAVADVQVVESDLGKTFANSSNHTSINFESKTGERFVVFTSKYAETLYNVTVPEGSGILKGVAGINKGTYQISLTSTSDYAGLTGARFDGSEPDPDPQPGEPKKVTIAEFLKAEVDDTVWYQLTGTLSNITNASYGNFDLTDETGTVYVWGLTAEKVSSNDKSFSSIGLKEGDIVTLVGTRTEHNGTAQVGGPAYYISHEEGETPDVPEGDPTALIISEYVEGSGFNKYIEIANISDKTVNLASYALVLYSNGKTSPESTVALEGTLEPGAVKVYKHADAALTLPEGVDSESNTAVNFSGDDAIVLTCNGENADVVGYIGEKIEWGKDKTFRRKTTVTAPTTEFNIDEWEQSSKDDVSGLGSF